MIGNNVKFENLDNNVKENIKGFIQLLKEFSDKFDASEKERIWKEVELSSRISGLENRLGALSEKALHVAVKEAATEAMERQMEKIIIIQISRLFRNTWSSRKIKYSWKAFNFF